MFDSFYKINVVILGATGKMGLPAVQTVLKQADMRLVGAVSRSQAGCPLPMEEGGPKDRERENQGLAYDSSLQAMFERLNASGQMVDVVVDLTHPDCVRENALQIVAYGARPVIGTTGLTDSDLNELRTALGAKQLGGIIAPNFAVGVLLLMQFAAKAAKYFDHAEIIELHHNQKADAPSGTALNTAHQMAAARENKPFGQSNFPEKELLPGARGAAAEADLHIHSVRLPGLVAHQEVLFGSVGELLTLRHDAFDRQAYMPGIMLAIRKVIGLEYLLVGMDSLVA